MKILVIFAKVVLGILIIMLLFVITLTVFEYRPKKIEEVTIDNNQSSLVKLDETYQALTFNIGYSGLGKDEDFVMDGGKKGRADSKDVVLNYFTGIKSILSDYPSDFYFLQEVDLKSRRSYQVNQVEGIKKSLGNSFSSQFAYNFKAIFVPFPVSLTDYMGPVQSGIQTLTSYRVRTSERHQFPGSFSWPLRVANLKRTMMVSYLDIEDSDKKLVLVNLHMSAYDSDGSLRDQEMHYLATFLEAEQKIGNYVIVGGDFNQTFPEADGRYPVASDLYQAYTIEKDFLPEGYRFEIDLEKPTCRLLNQPYLKDTEGTNYYLIDGYIVSNNIELIKIDSQANARAMTLDYEFIYSDHNPVIIKFKLLA